MVQASAVEDARGSSVRRVGEARAPTRASERLWGLEWPTWTCNGVTIEPTTFEAVTPFIAEHYPSIFATEPNRFLEEKLTPAKRHFLAECDVHQFRADGRVIGIAMGHPTDWATFYVRSIALLPKYRGRGVARQYFHELGSTLGAAGADRLEIETSAGNTPMNQLLLKHGFVITGTLNTDRWGAVLRYTRFLAPEARRVFDRQFMIVPAFAPERTGK